LRAALEAWLRQDPSVRSRVLLDVAETIRHDASNGPAAAVADIADDRVTTDSPADALDRVSPAYSRMRRIAPNVLMAGARVRGGTDAAHRRRAVSWFDIASVDGWTFIVLADGSSASPLAGIGARAACEAAIAALQQMPPRPPGDAAAARRAIHDAIVVASHAVLDAHRVCASRADDARALGRTPVPADFACSCLVAAHRAIDDAREQAMVVSAHAGRGMTGCIDTSGRTVVLGHDAIGGLDDVTLPLEDERLVAALERRTLEYAGDVSTLIVAGASVAESYASDERHLKRLEADLILNGILPVPHVGSASIDTARSTVHFASLSALPQRVEGSWRPASNGEREGALRSAVECARSFGIEWPELAREPLLLAAARVGTDATVPIDVRLRRWLASVRLGDDADDRTIVVWHRDPAMS
jgi:hypothetical protein